ncbi:MAG: methyltransferase domain-containing protein [Acidimicrobiales bacterium]
MRETYTHGHHESVLRSHTWRTAENSAGYLLDHLRPGMDLLDVGCGPGTITLDLARRVAPGRVVGVDASDAVIAEAQARATETGSAATFAVGDVYALDAEDRSFDVVHAHQVLQHLADPVAALRELRRVVRADGVVACRDSDYAAFVWAPTDPAPGPLERAVPRRHAGQRRRGGRPGATCSVGRRRPGSPTSWRRARRGRSPIPRPVPGGAACGPIASSPRPSPTRRSGTG